MSIDDIGGSMSWREACLLMGEIVTDPTSHLLAALAGWRHPASYEFALLAQLVDDFRQVHSDRRVKPWARPWDAAPAERLPRISDEAKDRLRRLAGR